MSTFSAERTESLGWHPTVKPVQLIKDVILDASNRKDVVVDGFLGSGTALVAAEQAHRVCYGVELEPGYVDVAITRWMNLTGDQAVHIESGQTYTQLRERRVAAEAV